MSESPFKVNDVVQIDPEHDEIFGGCFMVVTDPKPWGAMGYVKALERGIRLAYYRAPTEALVKIGTAEWVQPQHQVEQDG